MFNFQKYTLEKIHFGKIHFGKIHFGSKKLGGGGDLLGDGVNLLGAKVQKCRNLYKTVFGDQLTGWGGSSQKQMDFVF